MAARADLVVVGAGATGVYACLCAVREGARVVLVSGRPLAETASYWAQGGAAAALAPGDSPELHLQDTLTAGRGLVRRSAAEVLCAEAADRVRDLEALGVRFDADGRGELALGLEGGHSARRIVHAGGSATGRRILRELSEGLTRHPSVEVLEGARAARLLRDGDGRCTGVRCADGRVLAGRTVLLATGGAAALWARTTNPTGSFGGGLLLAREAGAAVADLEFVQFHPTAVAGVPGLEGFLISEAVRGEGATLHDAAGERFVDELAPRDAVARAIFGVLRASGEPAVHLDMTHVDPDRFPNLVAALRQAGRDPAAERIPVAPASHYMMGGVVSDLRGRTAVPGLYAAGECACTGLHGANRLASNSLSECFVFGRRAALAGLDEPAAHALPDADGAPPEPIAPAPSPATREAVWRLAGLERDEEGLRALGEDPHPLARLVAGCALARTESRGAHARADFPHTDPRLDGCHTVVPAASSSPRMKPWR